MARELVEVMTKPVSANIRQSPYPLCAQPDELPVGDRRLRFFVVAPRFWCDQPECDPQIFCERLE